MLQVATDVDIFPHTVAGLARVVGTDRGSETAKAEW